VWFVVGEIRFLELSNDFGVFSGKRKLMKNFELVGFEILRAMDTNRSIFCFMLVSSTLKMEATC
jgi:hypothetical protein